MNPYDIELPPLPDAEAYLYINGDHRGVSLSYHSDLELSEGTNRFPLITTDQAINYARAAIEADRQRIKQELEKWYEEAIVEHQKTRDPYYEGKGDAFDIAIQIVEGSLKK